MVTAALPKKKRKQKTSIRVRPSGNFPCTQCPTKVYAYSSGLARHRKQYHKNAAPIICGVCGDILKRGDYLMGHQVTLRCLEVARGHRKIMAAFESGKQEEEERKYSHEVTINQCHERHRNPETSLTILRPVYLEIARERRNWQGSSPPNQGLRRITLKDRTYHLGWRPID